MQTPLTSKQAHFWTYLQQQVAVTGQVPSLREAARELGVSHAAVAQYLKALETKGYVRREGRYSRTVYLLNHQQEPVADQRWREISVVGRIQAGLPMYAQQTWDGSLVVDRALYGGRPLFALRVQGDSMQAVGILEGDVAVCEPRQYARNGEIVVALVNHEEATVKRFFRHAEQIELRPENPRYQPLFYTFDQILIQGKVVGVHRGPDVMARL